MRVPQVSKMSKPYMLSRVTEITWWMVNQEVGPLVGEMVIRLV